MADQCENCMYYEYDEEFDEYGCGAGLDEDDMYRFLTGNTEECVYFRPGDEYQIVKHQM
ncbi:MAG: DUF6472 family protein [Lachnospiraceae bacterium]|nr:DUF6472 family protein [Lachnospiraceae bacterium]